MELTELQEGILAFIARSPGAHGREITERLGGSDRAVRRNLAQLVDRGYLHRRRMGFKGQRGYQNVYRSGSQVPPQIQPPPAPSQLSPAPEPPPAYNSKLDGAFWGDVRDAIIANWGRWSGVVGAAT